MKKIKKIFGIFVLSFFVITFGFYIWIQDKYVVPIITYHHINYSKRADANTVSPESFDRQLAFLKRNHYQILSLDELVEGIQKNRRFPKKSVVITFDDGNEDNYTQALPIIKKYNFSVTFFLISGLIDEPGFLKTEQVWELMKVGVNIGSHTKGHPYLPEYSLERQRKEIFESKRDLEEKFDIEIKHFVYPSGGFNDQIKRLVKEAGYESASTTNRGLDRFNKDLFELKRIRLKNRDIDALSLWIKLSGYYNLFRKSVNPE